MKNFLDLYGSFNVMRSKVQVMRSVLLSNFFLAALIAIPIIIWLPDHPTRYLLKLVNEIKLEENGHIFYRDINHDGVSETVHLAPGDGIPIMMVTNPGGNYFHESKFLGSYFSTSPVVFTDYNGNKIDEINFFIQRNDSVFLTWGELRLDKDPEFQQKYIFPLTYYNGKMEVKIDRVIPFDPTHSGAQSLLIVVSAGYSRQPREIFRYFYIGDSLLSTGPLGSSSITMKIADLNGDGSDEILTGSSASANYPDSSDIRFTDRSAWVVIFNDRLKAIDSLCMKANPGGVFAYPLSIGGSAKVFVLYQYGGTLPIDNYARLYDAKLDAYINIDFPDIKSLKNVSYLLPWKGNEAIYYILGSGSLLVYSNELKLQKKIRYPGNRNPILLIDTINLDIGPVFLFQTSVSNTFCLMKPGGEIAAEIPMNYVRYRDFLFIGTRFLPESQERLCLTVNNLTREYELHANFFWYTRWLLHLAIYAGIVLFLYLSQRIYQLRTKRQQQVKQELLQFQLNAALAHIEPHFTFNALNTIGGLISSGEKEKAYEYLLHFSKLLRSLLTNSDHVTVSLTDELNFVKHYLSLQQYSMAEKLSWSIDEPGNDLLEFPVPKRLIQTHVENAVKHGIRPKAGGGKVEIFFRKESEKLIINIDDTGIGREARQSSQLEESTGQGLKLTGNMLHSLKELGIYRSISQELIDLLDEQGNPAGTRVLISLEK
jgi:hypothetical protein